jgi:hypothetical protein
MRSITPTPPPQALYYGTARTPLVRVIPDIVYPGMYRLRWPDGQVSDLANLSRIKDAALVLCAVGPPIRNPQRLHWELDRSNSRSGARTRGLRPDPVSRPLPLRSRKRPNPCQGAADTIGARVLP